MKKLKNLTKAQLDEISHQIADAFYDYRYDPVESGLRKYIGSRENMFIYMNAIVRAAYKTGILYTTSDRHEGYMMLSGDGFKSISLIDGLKMISAEKKALGGFRKMVTFVKACFSDGGTIEARMKKAKKRFIRVEMLVVRKEYQKQGFMKQMLDDVYRLADHRGVAVILDTDDKNKCQRYEHLGMTLDRIRKCGDDLNMYDLIRESKKHEA